MAKRRVEITFERERLVVFGSRRVSVAGWCEGCGARSRMVMPDEAARLKGVTARAIYRLVETGCLHFLEGPEAGLLVCLESLNRISQDTAGGEPADGRKGEER